MCGYVWVCVCVCVNVNGKWEEMYGARMGKRNSSPSLIVCNVTFSFFQKCKQFPFFFTYNYKNRGIGEVFPHITLHSIVC